MATTTKKKAPAKPAARRQPKAASAKRAPKKAPAKKTSPAKHNLCAIFLFAAGLLLSALAFIGGEHVWLWLHEGLLGLFGVPAFFIGVLMMAAALLYASGRSEGTFAHKVWQLSLLFVCVCTEVQLLAHPAYPAGMPMGDCLLQTWADGVAAKGGGLVGGLIGVPLEYAFGRTASAIVAGVLIFVLALVLTGSTLIGFFKGVAKPVQAIGEGARKRQEQRKNAPKFDIDVPLDDSMPAHPVSSKKFLVPNIDAPKANRKKKDKQAEAAAPESASAVSEVPFDDPQPVKQKGLDELVDKAAKQEGKKGDGSSAPQLGGSVDADGYIFPPLTLLKPGLSASNRDASAELRANADRLVDTLRSFGVETRIINICRGPAVTRYELQPSAGVKISRITNLADDIALNLAAGGVRIEAPIPNKAAVGIEVPNKKKDMVSLREVLDSQEFSSAKSSLTFALGRDIAGNVAVADIAKMPHLLIAGATGSGKSVCINSLIISLLYKSSPQDVRLLMIDPKVVELGIYNGIPHLLVPVVTDPKKAAGALGWAVTEMLKRYKLFAETGARDLAGYNRVAHSGRTNAEGEAYQPMPQIVVIIDELADLMMAASKEVEDSICRLAQMARAAGMHLVIATQRPSVDVITGLIKSNIPSRIAFTVSSQVDSRTILDGSGAEKLLGRGDMLFNPVDKQKPVRIQGCFVSDTEVEQVVGFIKAKEQADYSDDILEEIEKQAVSDGNGKSDGGGFDDQDAMYPAAVEAVVEAGQASTSFLQRRLKLGYARAARIMDDMEAHGVVGPQEGSKPREVLMTRQQWLEQSLGKE